MTETTFRPGRKKAGRTYIKPSREMLLDLLETRELTIRRAAQIIQRDYETIRRAVLKLKGERLIHIANWEIHEVGPHEAVYALGDEPDAKNPKRLSDHERCRRYRVRRRPPPAPRDPVLRALMASAAAQRGAV